MKTRTMIPLFCASVALAIVGCTGDTVQPTASKSAYTPNNAVTDGTSGGTGSTSGGTGSTSGGTGSTSGDTKTGSTVRRPIMDFLSQQGTYCIQSDKGCLQFMPPVANMVSWFDQSHNMMIVADYAGLMNAFMQSRTGSSMGTTIYGYVSEEALPDGRARVVVNLSATNALVYIVNGPDVTNGPVYYGAKIQELMGGTGKPAFGQLSLQFSFINSAPGQPLPDLVQILKNAQSDQQYIPVSFRLESDGDFHNEFGQMQPAHISVASQGSFMYGYPGMEQSTPPMAYVNMQITPR